MSGGSAVALAVALDAAAAGPGSGGPSSAGPEGSVQVNAGAAVDAERTRLWLDTKGWMDEVCKRLQLSLDEASTRANVKDAATFQVWYETGKPHDVTRQLRVWVKNLLKDAQVSTAPAPT